MCGRAAQTYHAASMAASTLGATMVDDATSSTTSTTTTTSNQQRHEHASSSSSSTTTTAGSKILSGSHDNDEDNNKSGRHDNYNLSPGMDVIVIWNDPISNQLVAGTKLWGLISKPGTPTKPLPPPNSKERMGMHFSNLMFNARSDTLYEKPTFSKLASSHTKRTCVAVVDGYFEWKVQHPNASSKIPKQPYYVHSNDSNSNHPYLLIAGLWTSVPTGHKVQDVRTGEWVDESLDTFCMITTDACSCLQWLHHRMPMIVWDTSLIEEWLTNPSPQVLQRLEHHTATANTPTNLQWHAVTTEMSNLKYRSIQAIRPLPKYKTVTSFFNIAASTSKTKPKATTTTTKPNQIDKKKTSTIQSAGSSNTSQVQDIAGNIKKESQDDTDQNSQQKQQDEKDSNHNIVYSVDVGVDDDGNDNDEDHNNNDRNDTTKEIHSAQYNNAKLGVDAVETDARRKSANPVIRNASPDATKVSSPSHTTRLSTSKRSKTDNNNSSLRRSNKKSKTTSKNPMSNNLLTIHSYFSKKK